MKLIENKYAASGCFFCGEDNPIGLKLSFFETEGEPKEVVCQWTPKPEYKGQGNVLHGGIQSGLFDEIMGWATHHLVDENSVTGNLDIAFKRPVLMGQSLEVRCRILQVSGRDVLLEAELTNAGGVVCTSAKGRYVVLDPERFRGVLGG